MKHDEFEMPPDREDNLVHQLQFGDIVELSDGKMCKFIRLKRKKFQGVIEGTSYSIPITAIERLVQRGERKDPFEENLKKGDLFYILKESNGDALLFEFVKYEPSKDMIIGKNPITNQKSRIDKELYVDLVDNIRLKA